MNTVQAASSSPLETSNLNSQIATKWDTAPGWRQTIANALIITEREVRDSFRDWRIVLPIFLFTLVFPALANFSSNLFIGLIEDRGQTDVKGWMNTFLPLMPMLMGFFPISISLVIALETFVGEKERLSLEPLLSTPLTNIELYMGKVMAAIVPPLAAGYTGITLYVGGQVLGRQQWRPEASLIFLIFLLTTMQAIVMVTGAVVISSQTTSTRAANLLASMIIIPMALLVIIESVIMINPAMRHVLRWIAAGLFVAVVLLMRTGAQIFNREELLGRAIDHLNFRWAGRIIAEQWRGGVVGFSPIQWYRRSVFPAVRRLRPQMVVFLLCGVGFFIGGWYLSTVYRMPLEGKSAYDETVMNNMRNIFETGQRDPRFMRFVLVNNIRVLAAATLLSIFTFGVMGFYSNVVLGALGFIIGNAVQAGMNPLPFIAAVVPHGIFEVSALVIAGAAALRLGALVTRPPQNMTVSESWLRAFADTIKIDLAIVLPMLVFAAMLEIHLTPRVVEWVLTQH